MLPSTVAQTPAAPSADALAHFARRLSLETDCADVAASMRDGTKDFVLLHVVGSPEAYDKQHIPGAQHLPHGQITAERMAEWPKNTLFVVYCAGPHCNGADRAALRLAGLGRPVKLMLGGPTGWADERASPPRRARRPGVAGPARCRRPGGLTSGLPSQPRTANARCSVR